MRSRECGAGRGCGMEFDILGTVSRDLSHSKHDHPLTLTSACTQVNGMYDYEMVEELEKRGIYPSDSRSS